jgi:hypothetical protein
VSSVDDRELERYLRHDDPLSRVYAELKSERPSPALDQVVLARARDALKSAAPERRVYVRRWTAITAVAATVVLSFGLVMRFALEPESQVPVNLPTATDAVSRQPEAPAGAAKESRFEQQSSTPAAGTTRDSSVSPSSIEEQRPRIESEIRAAAEQAPAVPEPVPAPVATPRVHYVPRPAAAESDLRSGTPAAQPPMRREQAGDAASSERGLLHLEKAREAPAASAAVPDESVGNRNLADHAAPADEEFKRTPEAWLAEIERLRAAGEIAAADRELVQFNKAYPDYDEQLQPVDPAPERQ